MECRLGLVQCRLDLVKWQVPVRCLVRPLPKCPLRLSYTSGDGSSSSETPGSGETTGSTEAAAGSGESGVAPAGSSEAVGSFEAAVS